MDIFFGIMKRMHNYMQVHDMKGIPYRCRYTVQTPGGTVLPQSAGLRYIWICNANAVGFAL